MAFKSFKNNGVLIKPELTDDWVMSFECNGGMKISSKKLALCTKIILRTPIITFAHTA